MHTHSRNWLLVLMWTAERAQSNTMYHLEVDSIHVRHRVVYSSWLCDRIKIEWLLQRWSIENPNNSKTRWCNVKRFWNIERRALFRDGFVWSYTPEVLPILQAHWEARYAEEARKGLRFAPMSSMKKMKAANSPDTLVKLKLPIYIIPGSYHILGLFVVCRERTKPYFSERRPSLLFMPIICTTLYLGSGRKWYPVQVMCFCSLSWSESTNSRLPRIGI